MAHALFRMLRPRLLEPLADQHAISLVAWLLTLPGACVMTLVLTPGRVDGAFTQWMLLGGAVHVACGLLLLSVRAAMTNIRGLIRAAVVFGAICAIGATRGVLIGVSAQWLGWAHGTHLGIRIPGAMASFSFWLMLAIVLTVGTRLHRDTMQEIRQGLLDQRGLFERSTSELAKKRDELIRETRRTVALQLEGIRALEVRPEQAAERLRAVVDSVVRPLSHAIERQSLNDEADFLAETRVARPRLPLRRYQELLCSRLAFRPFASGLLVIASATPLSIHLLGFRLAVAALSLVGIVLMTCLVLARTTVPKVFRRSSIAVRSTAVVTSWLLIAAVSALVMMASIDLADAWTTDWSTSLQTQRAVSFAASAALSLGAICSCAVEAAVRAARFDAETELREVAARMRWALAKHRQAAWAQQQQLSRALHGNVQSRIVSLALQLQLHPPADVSNAISTLTLDIDHALSAGSPHSWPSTFDDIVALWSPAIQLSWDISPDFEKAMQADSVALRAVVEVLREGITNAVRHSAARHIHVTLAAGPAEIHVRIQDDGAGAGSISTPGLGTQLLDAVCLEWDLQLSDGGVLNACIPFTNSEQKGMAHV